MRKISRITATILLGFGALAPQNLCGEITHKGYRIAHLGQIDTDLKFSEFFSGFHTITAWVMPEFTYNYWAAIIGVNGSGTFTVGQGDYRQGNGDFMKAGDPVLWVQLGTSRALYLAPGYQRRKWNHLAVVYQKLLNGNGTIGLEIVEDFPDVDAVLVPFGGGGLSCGIAAAVRALRPEVRVYGCEPVTAAPLNASFAAGKPVAIERVATFVDGCGGRAVLPDMWPLISTLLSGAFAPSIAEIAAGVRMLAERSKIVAEGAGAVAIAAALSAGAPTGKIVCIVSGGCIDAAQLATILAGGVP